MRVDRERADGAESRRGGMMGGMGLAGLLGGDDEDDATVAAEDGSFRITGLGRRAVVLTATASGPAPNGATRDGMARIEGLEPSVDDVVVELEPAFVVRGTVVDERGDPVPKFEVEVEPRDVETAGNELALIASAMGGGDLQVFAGADGEFGCRASTTGRTRCACARRRSASRRPSTSRSPRRGRGRPTASSSGAPRGSRASC